VTFNNAPAGLFPTFAQLEGFEIAGADKKFYPAKAKIIGRTNTVEVSSEEVAQPVAVRYAFRNYVGNITLRISMFDCPEQIHTSPISISERVTGVPSLIVIE
jgi:hypothetical protein